MTDKMKMPEVGKKYFYEHNGRKLEFGKLHEPVKYCTLNDFINEHESLKSRVERLEKLIKEKNNV